MRDCIDSPLILEGYGFSQLEINTEIFATVAKTLLTALLWRKRIKSRLSQVILAHGQHWVILKKPMKMAIECREKSCYILPVKSNGGLVATIGVQNLIIIDTPDTVLVADTSCDQEAKHIYAEFKLNGHDAYKLHRTVYRTWGRFDVE